jgi:hypothetical protein
MTELLVLYVPLAVIVVLVAVGMNQIANPANVEIYWRLDLVRRTSVIKVSRAFGWGAAMALVTKGYVIVEAEGYTLVLVYSLEEEEAC